MDHLSKKNKKTAITVIMIVVGMFCLAYASFPLYSVFCKATGYGGTPKIANQGASALGKQVYTVRFNTDVAPDVPWEFAPVVQSVHIKSGENKLVYFYAINKSNKSITGRAEYNITPQQAGYYFNKIQCFCFTNQTLKAGEKVMMPVTFFIDPAIEKDEDLRQVETITLSYTFFQAKH